MSDKIRALLYNLLLALCSLVFALAVGGVILKIIGVEPLTTYKALLKGAFGNSAALSGTIVRWVPTVLCGLAVAVGFKGSVFNVGVEGQLIAGALCAAVVGYYVRLPASLHLPLVLCSGIAGGVAWVYLPAVLRFKRGVNAIFSTIMFNHLAKYLVLFLVNHVISGQDKQLGATEKIWDSAILPMLIKSPLRLNAGILIAVAAVVLLYLFIQRTRYGYELRVTGMNANAAAAAGISIQKHMLSAMLISGALAGLAGAVDVSGATYRIYSTYSPGYGGIGITVALLAKNNPWAVMLTALLFAAMKNGALMMQTTASVSAELVSLIQGLIIFFICCENLLRWLLQRRKGAK